MRFDWSDQQRELFSAAQSFGRDRLSAAPDGTKGFRRAFSELGGFGALGLSVDPRWGGMGLDAQTSARTMEGLGHGATDLGVLFSASAHLHACAAPIGLHGDDELRAHVLPRLCSGEWIGANAMTEPNAGSDVSRLETTARRDGDHYVLDGTKSYVTNGPECNVVLVYATTDPRAGFLGLTAFVVERSTPGIVVGERFETMGLESAPIGSMYFDGCRVPARNCLGGEGKGAAIFTDSMHHERTGLMAAWCGAMERQLDRVLEHAKERRQFRRPIGKFQAISHRIVDMKLRLDAARLLLYRACWARDQGDQATVEVSLAKLAISEAAIQSSLDAIQVFGGAGFVKEVGLERMLRDAVPTAIFSGTSEVQRDLVAKGLGL